MEIAATFTFIFQTLLFSEMSTYATFATPIHDNLISITEYKENNTLYSDIILKMITF
jgi:hypothetical protein